MRHPVLQLHQFLLQPQQLLEIGMAIERSSDVDIGDILEKLGEPRIVDLQFELFVEHLDHLLVQTLLRRKRCGAAWRPLHALLESVGGLGRDGGDVRVRT